MAWCNFDVHANNKNATKGKNTTFKCLLQNHCANYEFKRIKIYVSILGTFRLMHSSISIISRAKKLVFLSDLVRLSLFELSIQTNVEPKKLEYNNITNTWKTYRNSI